MLQLKRNVYYQSHTYFDLTFTPNRMKFAVNDLNDTSKKNQFKKILKLFLYMHLLPSNAALYEEQEICYVSIEDCAFSYV